MKDFTTSDYITPILEDISGHYFIDKAPAHIREYFKCILVLTPAKDEETHDAYFISEERRAALPDLETLQQLFAEIDDYTAAAETYPGELFYYNYHEKNRVISAMYKALILKYNN